MRNFCSKFSRSVRDLFPKQREMQNEFKLAGKMLNYYWFGVNKKFLSIQGIGERGFNLITLFMVVLSFSLIVGCSGEENASEEASPSIRFNHNVHVRSTYKLTNQVLQNLEEDIPADILKGLISLKNKKINSVTEFTDTIEKTLGKEQSTPYLKKIVKQAKQAGQSCSKCHRFYQTQENSGYPDLFICMECHSNPVTESPEEEKLRQFEKEKRKVVWTRVTRMPRHVRYSHKRHVMVAKLECKTCHGQIGQLTAPPDKPLIDISMTFCLDCHKTDHFEINKKSIKKLKKTKLSPDILKILETVENQKFRTEHDLFSNLERSLSYQLSASQKVMILNQTFASEPITTDCIACHR